MFECMYIVYMWECVANRLKPNCLSQHIYTHNTHSQIAHSLFSLHIAPTHSTSHENNTYFQFQQYIEQSSNAVHYYYCTDFNKTTLIEKISTASLAYSSPYSFCRITTTQTYYTNVVSLLCQSIKLAFICVSIAFLDIWLLYSNENGKLFSFYIMFVCNFFLFSRYIET